MSKMMNENKPENKAGILYLVATPIGNLGDLSPRGRETLTRVDFIAAEDTRVTHKLLVALDLPMKPMVSYYEHNRKARGGEILNRLLAGESCALVTDAGMPAISDPGEDMVALAAENGIEVRVVPGCCAAVSGLALSGLPTGRFCFEGFLPVGKKQRGEHLSQLIDEPRTMIFYEAPHKLCTTLEDLCYYFGADRRVALCREMTKLYEETQRTTLGEARDFYQLHAPRGEFVLIVDGAPEKIRAEDEEDRMRRALERVRDYLSRGRTLKDAVKAVSLEIGVKKNALYQMALQLDQG